MLARDKKVFCDLKFFDIPVTVGSAVRQLKDRGASFVTVHGNRSMMEAAAENKGDTLKVKQGRYPEGPGGNSADKSGQGRSR